MQEIILNYYAVDCSPEDTGYWQNWYATQFRQPNSYRPFVFREELNYPEELMWDLHQLQKWMHLTQNDVPEYFVLYALTFCIEDNWTTEQVYALEKSWQNSHLQHIENDYGIIGGTPDPAWQLLGYDVADLMKVSALSYCDNIFINIPEPYVSTLREGNLINQRNLFSCYEDTHEYIKYANELVKDHVPFFTYGYWMIEGNCFE